MTLATKIKFLREIHACGKDWPSETVLTNLYDDLDTYRGLCATLPDGQLVTGLLLQDIEIVELPSSNPPRDPGVKGDL